MTKIRKNIYNLMDSFLVETDKPRPIDRLNQDRHLFVDNVENLFRSWALENIVPEEGIQWMQEGNHKVNERGYTKGFNACRDLVLKKIEDVGK